MYTFLRQSQHLQMLLGCDPCERLEAIRGGWEGYQARWDVPGDQQTHHFQRCLIRIFENFENRFEDAYNLLIYVLQL